MPLRFLISDNYTALRATGKYGATYEINWDYEHSRQVYRPYYIRILDSEGEQVGVEIGDFISFGDALKEAQNIENQQSPNAIFRFVLIDGGMKTAADSGIVYAINWYRLDNHRDGPLYSLSLLNSRGELIGRSAIDGFRSFSAAVGEYICIDMQVIGPEMKV